MLSVVNLPLKLSAKLIIPVGLEAVTETVDSTEVGKLITYIRGFAAKLEAEKIKERSIRGRRATAREWLMPRGFQRTYGYDYIKIIKGEREARRVINETEALGTPHV
jgi:DNA invertase Pin-like site-specific DNA recombinase